MAVVKPFAGVRYDPEKVKMDEIIAPPYDVISDEEQENLYERSPYNVIRLILGKVFDDDTDTNNRYSRAREFLNRWLEEGVLKVDPPAFYFVEQEYKLESGKVLKRKGIIGRVKLEELGKGVKPHERTLDAPKEDRFKLMTAVEGNLSPVFSLFKDPELTIENLWDSLGEPDFSFTDTVGIPTRVWVVSDPDRIKVVEDTLADKKLFIADGHHRYETALNFRKYYREKNNIPEDQEHPVDYVMMYLVNSEDEGLMILPTHRLIHSLGDLKKDFVERLQPYFELKEVPISGDSSLSEIYDTIEKTEAPMILLTKEGAFEVIPKEGTVEKLLGDLPPELRSLNVNLLHRGILEKIMGISMEEQAKQKNVKYIKELKKGLDLLKEGRGDFLFLMKPLTMEDVERVTSIGERMPQKSTYFYPKIPSGIVFHLFGYQKD